MVSRTLLSFSVCLSAVVAEIKLDGAIKGRYMFFSLNKVCISGANLRCVKPLCSNFHVLSGEIELQCFKFGLRFAGHVFACMDAL